MQTVAALNLKWGKKLGEGGTGTVFRAKDELGREVAIKFFHDNIAPIRSQIIHHIDALKKIDHPSVVKLYNLVDSVHPEKEGDTLYPAIIMEYIPGDSFGDWLAHGPKQKEEVISVLTSFIDGIEQFHKINLVHGDIHGDNIRVVNGITKLIDPVAHDPAMVHSTGLTAERKKRDLHELKFHIHQTLIDFGANKAIASSLGLFNSIPLTLEELREVVLTAFNTKVEDGGMQEQIEDTDFYSHCRQAQRSGDKVQWQDCRDKAVRLFKPQFDSCLLEHLDLKNENDRYGDFSFRCIERISGVSGLILAAAKHGGSEYTRDFNLLRHIANYRYPQGTQQLPPGLYELIVYLLQHMAGAACCLNGNLEAALVLTDLSMPYGETGYMTMLWKHGSLTVSPHPIQNWRESSKILRRAFESSQLVRAVFASASDYHVGLTAYNMLLSCREYASIDNQAVENMVENKNVHTENIPEFLLSGTEELSSASTLLFDDSNLKLLLEKKYGKTTKGFDSGWEKWLIIAEEVLNSLRHFGIIIPDFLKYAGRQ